MESRWVAVVPSGVIRVTSIRVAGAAPIPLDVLLRPGERLGVVWPRGEAAPQVIVTTGTA